MHCDPNHVLLPVCNLPICLLACLPASLPAPLFYPPAAPFTTLLPPPNTHLHTVSTTLSPTVHFEIWKQQMCLPLPHTQMRRLWAHFDSPELVTAKAIEARYFAVAWQP